MMPVVTTVGVAPAMAATTPVVDAAMPGFAALLATVAPAVTAEVATPQPQPLPVGPPLALSIRLVSDVTVRVTMSAPSFAGALPLLTPPSSSPRDTALSAPVDALAQAKPLTAEAVSIVPAALSSVIAQAAPAVPGPLSHRTTATECMTLGAAAPEPSENRDEEPDASDVTAVATPPLVLASVLAPAPQPARQLGDILAAAPPPPTGPQPSAFDAKVSVPQPALAQPTGRRVADLHTPSASAPIAALALPMPATVRVEPATSSSFVAMVSMSNSVPGASAPQPAAAASVVVASAASLAVNASAAPVIVAPSVAMAPLRAGPMLRDPRQKAEERDRLPVPVALPEAGPLRVALRSEAPEQLPAAAPDASSATGVDIGIKSDRLGAVRIGIDGAPGDLRVSLGLSPAAAALVAADAPRLIADLAANGVRLQSLDVSGGGFAGGQAPSPGQQQPQSPAPMVPRAAVPAALAAVNPAIVVRTSTADRYA